MSAERIGFSKWEEQDYQLAESLWGDPEVTRYICVSGIFSLEDVARRLKQEIANDREYGIQYWPIFEIGSNAFVGCCGLRPRNVNEYEIGFHLRPEFWGRGYAAEAAKTVIHYAFKDLKAEKLFAGHNPANAASQKVLRKLGFAFIGDEFYPPTGLYHPSYELKREEFCDNEC